MGRLLLITFIVLFASISSAAEVPKSLRADLCDALEWAIDNPDGYDNDIYHCGVRYERQLCLDGEFRKNSADHYSLSVKDRTCDCGVLRLEKPHAESGLLWDIGGCA